MKLEITTLITYRYLMNKTKSELAHMILDLLDEKLLLEQQIDELEEYKWMYEDNSR